jgi:hypothetical protein
MTVPLKVDDLVDFNSIFLMLSAGKQNCRTLGKDWGELLSDHPILCDLRSDIVEAQGQLLESLKVLDAHNEMPYGKPAPVSGKDRFVILFTQRHFQENAETRKSITLHELGHFYVFYTELLKDLRLKWPAGEEMFETFVSLVRQDPNWYCKNLEWLRNFYNWYVLDLLKIPGEIYANLWVKENFTDYFDPIVTLQTDHNICLVNNIENTVKTRAVKFPLFCIILHFEGLLMLQNGITNTIKDKVSDALSLCWKKMSRYLPEQKIRYFKKMSQEIMNISSSPRIANEKLFALFEEYVKANILEPSDFA